MDNFRSLNQPAKYYKYKECDKDQVLVDSAEFVETFEGKYGAQHKFTEEDGTDVVLNSAGHLNWQVDKLKAGDKCRVIYKGELEVPKGPMAGKMAHQFDVQVAKATMQSVESETSLDDLE